VFQPPANHLPDLFDFLGGKTVAIDRHASQITRQPQLKSKDFQRQIYAFQCRRPVLRGFCPQEPFQNFVNLPFEPITDGEFVCTWKPHRVVHHPKQEVVRFLYDRQFGILHFSKSHAATRRRKNKKFQRAKSKDNKH
jgi:hypothetical protein